MCQLADKILFEYNYSVYNLQHVPPPERLRSGFSQPASRPAGSTSRVQTFICPFVRGQTNAKTPDSRLLLPHPKWLSESGTGMARLDLIDLFNFHKTPDSDKRSVCQPVGFVRSLLRLLRYRPRQSAFAAFGLSNCLSVRPCELAASSKFAISILFPFRPSENGLYFIF